MLKACKHCGRIHDSKYDCGKKPVRQKQGNNKDKFRWTRAWQKKREEIKERDNCLCQICIRNLHDTDTQYTYEELEVHHATSLEENFNKRLDSDNLITICSRHHKMAESGAIPYGVIKVIIEEQEKKI